jgi:chemotaxis protein MotB
MSSSTTLRRIAGASLVLALLPACVTKSEHEAALANASRRLQAAQQQHAAIQAQLQGQLQQRDQLLAQAQAREEELKKKLDDATALNDQLSKELEKLGKDVSTLVAQKGSLNDALDETKKRLDELRKAQLAAKKRAQLFRDLALKFKKMVDAGDLKIVLRDGRMVLQLRNDVLFDSGKTSIKDEGKSALEEVARILVTLDDRKLQVAGHTDNVPISTSRYPSNWELSTARAVSVVKYLVEQGVKSTSISAAGYSEHDPVNDNESDEGKSRNRRIEIVLQPNIAELVSIPEV